MIKTEDSLISPPQRHSSDSQAVITSSASLAEENANYPEIVIQPQSGWIAIDWKEMFAYRELLIFLVKRDISVRYKQTVLGSAWAVLHPLMLMLIFTFFFGRLVSIKSEGVPYPVFVFAALIPWTLFSQGFAAAAVSLANQQNLLTKVYFPRLFVPIGGRFRIPGRPGLFPGDLRIRVALLPRHAELDDHLRAPAGRGDADRHVEPGRDAVGAHGLLSRLPALGSVPHADFHVFHPGDLSGGPDSREVSLVSGPQSDVRARFRVPLGDSRSALAF